MTWKQLSRDRKTKRSSRGFDIIAPCSLRPSVPIFCPVCKFLMSSFSDTHHYQKYQCCFKCALKWAESNRIKWIEERWRPSKDEISIEISKRLKRPLNITF